jgi:exopolyphosphatase/guanosine-5'-triphosphate,3'-diphosphate pyrophosphatase
VKIGRCVFHRDFTLRWHNINVLKEKRANNRSRPPRGRPKGPARPARRGGRRAVPTSRRPDARRLSSTPDQPAAPQAAFPVRLASVDAGSNAIRLLVAEFRAPGQYEVLTQERASVRLGHGVFLTGRLTEASMDAAVEVLTSFATTMRDLRVAACRAVATSAVREASNGERFRARVRKQAGLDLGVISGSEEARFVHLAVRGTVDLAGREWVLADLGGGSVEVSLIDDGGILWSESHTMGSIRLLEELSQGGDEPGGFYRLLEEYTNTLRLPSAARYRNPAGFIATGGNIESLALLAGLDAGPAPARLPLARLLGIIETLSHLSYRERVEQLGLREDRADVVLPAALVYARLAKLAGAAEIVVPKVGLKEGVLLDLAEDVTARPEHVGRIEAELSGAAISLGRRYMFDEGHARQVTALALSLFDQLGPLHGLGASERRLLLAAGLLHDVGQYISYKRHHKHSLYLISASELPGFSEADIGVVANVARYHRRSGPSGEHEAFAVLSPSDQARVKRLAAILRLADALDREHSDRVKRVVAEIGKNEVLLRLEGNSDLLLEKWSLERKSQLFRDTFKLDVRAVIGNRS